MLCLTQKKLLYQQVPRQRVKKLVCVSANSALMARVSEEANHKVQECSKLQSISCIHNAILFGEFCIKALID